MIKLPTNNKNVLKRSSSESVKVIYGNVIDQSRYFLHGKQREGPDTTFTEYLNVWVGLDREDPCLPTCMGDRGEGGGEGSYVVTQKWGRSFDIIFNNHNCPTYTTKKGECPRSTPLLVLIQINLTHTILSDDLISFFLDESRRIENFALLQKYDFFFFFSQNK